VLSKLIIKKPEKAYYFEPIESFSKRI